MTLKALKATLKEKVAAVTDAFVAAETQRMALAIALYDLSSFMSQDERLGRFIDQARELCPGESDPALYRLANAGAVAAVIGDTGSARERHLAPLYRILKAAKEEDREAAETLVSETWKEACSSVANGKTPTEETILELVGKVAPDGGTRGAKKGTKKGTKQAKQTAPTSDEQNDTDAEATEKVREEIVSYLTLRASKGADASAVRVIMLATAKLCDVHGSGVVFAALQGVKPSTIPTVAPKVETKS